MREVRNEIFARHGYVFKTEKYRECFGKKKWYRPDECRIDGGARDGRW